MKQAANADVQEIMHGLSEQTELRAGEKPYQNIVRFPRISTGNGIRLLLPQSVKSARMEGNTLLLLLKAVYHEERYTYRYFDYRPVFEELSNTDTLCVRLGFTGEDTLRVTMGRGFTPPATQELLLSPEAEGFVPSAMTEDGAAIRLTSGTMTAVIHKEPWNLTVEDAQGKVIYRQFGRDEHSFMPYEICPFGLLFDGESGETYACEAVSRSAYERDYGLGEHFSALDCAGQQIDQWNTNALGINTDRTYKNIPFYISSEGYAVFHNTCRKLRFDMGHTLSKANTVLVGGDTLDFFILRAPTAARALSLYTKLTGKPVLPPKWSFGIWMSRISYGTEEEVNDVAARMRQEKLPCDVIHIDTDWFAENWICDWKPDPKKFPDFSGMIERLHQNGFRLSLWQLPYVERGSVSTEVYDRGVRDGYFAAEPSGDLRFRHGLIDFSNPEAVKWYQEELLRPLLEMGVDVIKVDFGESAPGFFRYAGIDSADMHNAYALLYNRAVFDITEEVKGEGNGIIWARSAWAGSQKYPLHWGGDAGTDFGSLASSVRGCLNIGLSGFPFWSSDIGGFWFLPEPVLYIRWLQFGMFCSHARFHGFYAREPWAFGEEAVSIYRRFAELRYRLLPYILAEAEKAVSVSQPMHRALVLDYPNDPTVETIDTEYLFGEALLVCPVLNEEGRVRIYLPEGVWTDFFTNDTFTGPQWLERMVPLDTMPVFVREGSILPMGPVMQHVEEIAAPLLTLRLYPGKTEGHCVLADGGPEAFLSLQKGEVRVTVSAYDRELRVELVNTGAANCTDGASTWEMEEDGCVQALTLPAGSVAKGAVLRFPPR